MKIKDGLMGFVFFVQSKGLMGFVGSMAIVRLMGYWGLWDHFLDCRFLELLK